ncbi:putative helicase mov-10-B.2 [Drosophila innubila]|uniref:putative helicase mov-10-B.2 n=1 Tax=Drosophila innubila TaxID=198719 RepID=UPI00148BC28D|nr:putative helicase mov-10-B.2 [Drosophila innubila]
MNVNKLSHELESINLQLSTIANMVTRWTDQVGKLKEDVHFSNEDDDNSSFEDEEETQQEKFGKIMRSLPHYEPKQPLLQALEVNFTNESLSTKDDTFGTYLQTECLNYDNVCSVLSTLLSIEDVSTMQLYAQLMQPNVTLKKVSKFSYSFTLLGERQFNPEDVVMPQLDEVVLVPTASLLASPLPEHRILALLPHKHENLRKKDPMRRFVAFIVQVTRQSIQLQFRRNNFPGDTALAQRFYVILRSRRTPFRYMYRAMQLLQESPQLRRYLFPTKSSLTVSSGATNLPNLALLNASIASNMEQLQAVKNIVNGPNIQAPYIVFGPPGTGKTTTIVEAILQLRLRQPRSRILVTAGSNSACDTIALKICEYFAGNKRLQTILADRAQESRLVTLDVEQDHQIIRLFSRSIFAKGLSAVHPLLLQHSNCAKRVFDFMSVNTLRQYGIIVATLCTVGRLVTTNLGKFNFFTHVFIDEAGASMEPETLIGIMGIKQQDTCHVILSGDHKQLSAVITSNRAAHLGLRHSLMERLLRSDFYALDDNGKYDHTLQTRLRRNYRSHPEIVGLFNKLYYNGELIPQAPPGQVNLAANWKLLPNPKFPIVFQATHGETKREFHSTSSYNALEVQVVIWYVKQLLNNGLGGGVRVTQEDIGIVAPYLGQCRLVTEMLRLQGYVNVEVGSVEKYQGREKAIIIATLVRSFASMGFMRDPRRINVLLSRAKSLMILIGNPVTLRHHRDFKFIINQCKLEGNYLFKKKDGARRPQFLIDFDDIEDEDESEEEFIPWYADMPEDICIPLPSIHYQLNTATYDSSTSGDSESFTDTSSSLSSSKLNTQLPIEMDNLWLCSPKKITMPLSCGSASLITNQKLLQLQIFAKRVIRRFKLKFISSLLKEVSRAQFVHVRYFFNECFNICYINFLL